MSRLLIVSFLVLPLLALTCRDVPLEERSVLRVSESVCAPGLTLEVDMGQGWFVPGWVAELDPPIQGGDCPTLVPGVDVDVRVCCEDLCVPPEVVSAMTQPCTRMFTETGDEYPSEEVAEWNAAHGPQ